MRTGQVGKDHWTQEDDLVAISEVFGFGDFFEGEGQVLFLPLIYLDPDIKTAWTLELSMSAGGKKKKPQRKPEHLER